jgi:ATP-dependent Lhr-like helicase
LTQMPAVLDHFSAPVREWFERAFGEPTPPQVEAWPPIGRGETTLISAPTGSGKTLAAFLWANRPPDRMQRGRASSC